MMPLVIVVPLPPPLPPQVFKFRDMVMDPEQFVQLDDTLMQQVSRGHTLDAAGEQGSRLLAVAGFRGDDLLQQVSRGGYHTEWVSRVTCCMQQTSRGRVQQFTRDNNLTQQVSRGDKLHAVGIQWSRLFAAA